MNIKLKKMLPLFLFLIMLLPSSIVSADTGPKPTMDFIFEQQGEQLTITSGVLFECQQADCSDARRLEQLGPQGFSCNESSCRALAYGFAPYHKIEIEFSDGKTRESNIFETGGFNSSYTVTVREDDLFIDAPSNLVPRSFPRVGFIVLLCACVSLIGIGIVVVIVFMSRRSAKK